MEQFNPHANLYTAQDKVPNHGVSNLHKCGFLLVAALCAANHHM